MKITKDNVLEKWADVKLLLKDKKDFIDLAEDSFIPFADLYDDFDDDMKKDFNLFIDKTNELLEAKEKEEKETPAPKPTPKPEPKPKPQPKPGQKPKAEKKAAMPVEMVALERKYIARFLSIENSKKGKAEKIESMRRLLSALQQSIVRKEVRKTSNYAKELNFVQKSLVSCINSNQLFELDEETRDKLKEIATSETEAPSVKIARKFIRMQAKTVRKEDAKKLLNLINEAIKNDVATDEIKAMKQSVSDFVDGKTSRIETSERDLRGIRGLGNLTTPGSGEISTEELLNRRFRVLRLQGKWAEFVGKPSETFKMMIYGTAGNGKSTFALLFANHLANVLGMKVLYVSAEEKFGYTLKDKIRRLNMTGQNIFFAEDLNGVNMDAYDVVFIDSINELKMTSQDLKALPADKAYVWIVQCTKDGHYKGDQGLAHDCDIVINVEHMRAYSEKNRYNAAGLEFDVEW